MKNLKKPISEADLNHIRIMAYENKYPHKYKDTASKSPDQIYQELIDYYHKYGVVNYHYYIYRLDRKGNNTFYYPYKPVHIERLKLNGAFKEFNYIPLVRDKFIFQNYFSAFGIPIPEIIATYLFKKFKWSKKPSTNTRLFFKALEANCAKGILTIDYNLDSDQLLLDGKPISISQINEIMGGNYIVQEKIEQHPDIDQFYSSSLNTVRIVTYRTREEDIKILGYIFRVGCDGKTVDNWAQGGIMLSVNKSTGEVNDFGTKKVINREDFYEHPNSKIRFKNFKLPYFEEIIDLVIKAHKILPELYTIGWDVGITPNGPILLEGNDDWDLSMFQYLYGKEILEEVFPWIGDFCKELEKSEYLYD